MHLLGHPLHLFERLGGLFAKLLLLIGNLVQALPILRAHLLRGPTGILSTDLASRFADLTLLFEDVAQPLNLLLHRTDGGHALQRAIELRVRLLLLIDRLRERFLTLLRALLLLLLALLLLTTLLLLSTLLLLATLLLTRLLLTTLLLAGLLLLARACLLLATLLLLTSLPRLLLPGLLLAAALLLCGIGLLLTTLRLLTGLLLLSALLLLAILLLAGICLLFTSLGLLTGLLATIGLLLLTTSLTRAGLLTGPVLLLTVLLALFSLLLRFRGGLLFLWILLFARLTLLLLIVAGTSLCIRIRPGAGPTCAGCGVGLTRRGTTLLLLARVRLLLVLLRLTLLLLTGLSTCRLARRAPLLLLALWSIGGVLTGDRGELLRRLTHRVLRRLLEVVRDVSGKVLKLLRAEAVLIHLAKQFIDSTGDLPGLRRARGLLVGQPLSGGDISGVELLALAGILLQLLRLLARPLLLIAHTLNLIAHLPEPVDEIRDCILGRDDVDPQATAGDLLVLLAVQIKVVLSQQVILQHIAGFQVRISELAQFPLVCRAQPHSVKRPVCTRNAHAGQPRILFNQRNFPFLLVPHALGDELQPLNPVIILRQPDQRNERVGGPLFIATRRFDLYRWNLIGTNDDLEFLERIVGEVVGIDRLDVEANRLPGEPCARDARCRICIPLHTGAIRITRRCRDDFNWRAHRQRLVEDELERNL